MGKSRGGKKRKGASSLDRAAEKYVRLERVRPLVQLVPFGVGSAIDSLFGDRAVAIQIGRLDKLCQEIKRQLKQMDEGKIDKSYLESGDFFYHCRDIFAETVRSRNEDKLERFARVFISGIAKDRPTAEFLSLCTELVSELELPEMLILRALHAHRRVIRIDGSSNVRFVEGKKPGEIKEFCAIGEITAGQFQVGVRKLQNLGLIGISSTYNESANFSAGNYIWMTDLAREFLSVVLPRLPEEGEIPDVCVLESRVNELCEHEIKRDGTGFWKLTVDALDPHKERTGSEYYSKHLRFYAPKWWHVVMIEACSKSVYDKKIGVLPTAAVTMEGEMENACGERIYDKTRDFWVYCARQWYWDHREVVETRKRFGLH